MRDTKGTFHAKMGTMKERNGMDLKKQKILRKGGKNTQKVKVKSFSWVHLFATPWTVAYQASPSTEFSRQEYLLEWVAISFSRGYS